MTESDRAPGLDLASLPDEAEPIVVATCEMGDLLLFEDRLSFRGSPTQARLGRGQPDRDLALGRIATVEWRQPAFWRMGRLRIVLASRGASTRPPDVAHFAFQTWERRGFETLRTELERRLEGARAAAIAHDAGAGGGGQFGAPAPQGAGGGSAAGGTSSATRGQDAGGPGHAGGDVPEQIRKLGQLRDEGLLTAEEFETKKRELLARM